MSESPGKIKVFFIEDNPDDVELELYELRNAGFEVEHDIARNRKEFLDGLSNLNADIILADYSLPDITGIEAIGICKDKKIDVPVILITGDGNELIAVDSLRLGAIDYILKKNIAGLSARVSRALEIWNDRRAKERAEAEEKRLQQLLFENQKMESVGRLAGGIAHDFNNILSGILGFSQLCLVKVSRDSDIYSRLQSIITLSLRGADLVKQLLIFSKKMPMEFKTVELNSFIVDTVQFLKRIVEETIDIKLELRDDTFYILCDTGKFTQVLMNLVLNARDAMNGKGTVTIKTEKCLFLSENFQPVTSSELGRQYISLSVSDTGVGIDDENISKIFEPFYTTKDVGKGTGLGLAIVHSVVNAHGGHIKVSSKKGEATSFKIYLPALKSDFMESEPPPSEKTDKIGINEIHGRETILLAEDDDMLRELTVSVLHSFGYNVLSARDGEEALHCFAADGQKIDLVISDMLMPQKGGVELFKELKTINPLVKFILVTGYGLSGQDEKILEQIDAILLKPYMPIQIARLIRDILDG